MSRGGRGARFLKKMGRGGEGRIFHQIGRKIGGVLFLTTTTNAEIYFEKIRVNIKEKYLIFGLGGQKYRTPLPIGFFLAAPPPSFLTLIVYGKFANFPWYIHFYVYSAPGKYFLRGGWEYFRRGAAKMGGSIFCARGGSTIYQIPELVQFVTNYYQHILIRRVGRGGSI